MKKSKKKGKKKCPKGYTINPETGYCIKIGGPTYNKLVRFGKLVTPLQTLPQENLFNILLNVPPKDLPNFCATKKIYAAICSDSQFRKLYKAKWKSPSIIVDIGDIIDGRQLVYTPGQFQLATMYLPVGTASLIKQILLVDDVDNITMNKRELNNVKRVSLLENADFVDAYSFKIRRNVRNVPAGDYYGLVYEEEDEQTDLKYIVLYKQSDKIATDHPFKMVIVGVQMA